MDPRAVVKQLKEYGQRPPFSEWGELDEETRTLVQANPFAFLIAVAFDRGMPWQKAWRIPLEIKLKGCLDPEWLASKGEAELVELLERLAVRPRYGGARTLSDAARLVCERFGGDAAAIWKDTCPAQVEKTLQEIRGVGPGIASMATRILYDDFGCFRGQERQIDVKPDVHLLRVFQRLGFIDDDSEKEAVRAARRLSPEFPGELDWPAWRIGQQWCHPRKPDCTGCPMDRVCAKRGL